MTMLASPCSADRTRRMISLGSFSWQWTQSKRVRGSGHNQEPLGSRASRLLRLTVLYGASMAEASSSYRIQARLRGMYGDEGLVVDAQGG
jgi:hypothetical protein